MNAINQNRSAFGPRGTYSNNLIQDNSASRSDAVSPWGEDQVSLGGPAGTGLYSPKMFQSLTQSAETPQTNPVVTREEFLKQYGDKTISARTKLPGMAYLDRADLNYDGVISGQAEWEAAFRQVDLYDKNGKAESVDRNSDERVGKSLDNLGAAEDGAKAQKPAYSKAELKRMDYALESPDALPNQSAKLPAGSKDYLGRPLSNQTSSLPITAGAGNGYTLVADPKSGRMYKQGAEGGPIVPLTPDEQKQIRTTLKDALDPAVDGNEAYSKVYYTLYPEKRPEECSY